MFYKYYNKWIHQYNNKQISLFLWKRTSETIISKFFNRWRYKTYISLEEKQRSALASLFYNQKLVKKCIYCWINAVIDRRRKRSKGDIADEHYYGVLCKWIKGGTLPLSFERLEATISSRTSQEKRRRRRGTRGDTENDDLDYIIAIYKYNMKLKYFVKWKRQRV